MTFPIWVNLALLVACAYSAGSSKDDGWPWQWRVFMWLGIVLNFIVVMAALSP